MTTGESTAKAEVIVQNLLGLHLRAAMKFVDLASNFSADISVFKDERRVNGKSILEMMTLAAEKGATFTIEAGGADAREALNALTALVRDRFGEES